MKQDLVDGRASIADEVAQASETIRNFIANSIRDIPRQPDFQDAFSGHLSAPFPGTFSGPNCK